MCASALAVARLVSAPIVDDAVTCRLPALTLQFAMAELCAQSERYIGTMGGGLCGMTVSPDTAAWIRPHRCWAEQTLSFALIFVPCDAAPYLCHLGQFELCTRV